MQKTVISVEDSKTNNPVKCVDITRSRKGLNWI